MNEKYYTPEIEEFHVGFEYQIFEDWDYYPIKSWHNQVYGKDGDNQEGIGYVSEPMSDYRVKHLDREDIESFEFIKSGLAKDVFISKETHDIQGIGENYIIGINFKEGTDYVQVFYTRDEERAVGAILFAGRLKNKSELKRILKQIGV